VLSIAMHVTSMRRKWPHTWENATRLPVPDRALLPAWSTAREGRAPRDSGRGPAGEVGSSSAGLISRHKAQMD